MNKKIIILLIVFIFLLNGCQKNNSLKKTNIDDILDIIINYDNEVSLDYSEINNDILLLKVNSSKINYEDYLIDIYYDNNNNIYELNIDALGRINKDFLLEICLKTIANTFQEERITNSLKAFYQKETGGIFKYQDNEIMIDIDMNISRNKIIIGSIKYIEKKDEK